MKFNSSTLFVNTGRKPLPGMQKKKKPNKNNIALAFCIVIITVLCVFVGLIAHVWMSYDEQKLAENPEDNTNEVVVIDDEPQTEIEEEPTPEKTEKEEKTETAKKPAKKTTKKTTKKKANNSKKTTSGKETSITKLVTKEFQKVDADYSFGIMTTSDGSTYINNSGKVNNSAALAPFLADYSSNGIYLGTFDYDVYVGDYSGDQLMNRAFSEGSVDAANMLIEHFGVDSLNAYMEAQGYTGTHFGGTIGSSESYTTAEDLVKLMDKFRNNTTFFPYSDIYKKMSKNTVRDKIMKSLPEDASGVNITFTTEKETVDAAIVYTPSGNFIFVAMAEGDSDGISAAHKAMSSSASKVCKNLASSSGSDD